MRSARGFRMVLPAACLGGACVLLFVAVLFGQDGADRICPELVERVIPITHKGVRYENVLVIGEVPVPCETPSTARVKTRINPNPIDRSQVDMDREAVDGEGVW